MYELWMRIPYKKLITEKKLRTIVRPGERIRPNSKGTSIGEEALVRIIVKPGDESAGILPQFDRFLAKVKITKLEVKKISTLTPQNLKDCSPDCRSQELVKYHLGLIYNREFQDEDKVTIIGFDYL